MIQWVKTKLKQPGTYAGIASLCTAIAQSGNATVSAATILAALGLVIINA